jgi:hypothetical protein
MEIPFDARSAADRSVVELCGAYPSYCVRYFARKLSYYIFPVLPKYSPRHKAFNALYFGSLLLLSGIGLMLLLRRAKREGGWHWFWQPSLTQAAYVLCTTLMVTATVFHFLTHIDSDTRNLIVWTLPWVCGAFLQLELVLRNAESGLRNGHAMKPAGKQRVLVEAGVSRL